jgi:hypothetical protein
VYLLQRMQPVSLRQRVQQGQVYLLQRQKSAAGDAARKSVEGAFATMSAVGMFFLQGVNHSTFAT